MAESGVSSMDLNFSCEGTEFRSFEGMFTTIPDDGMACRANLLFGVKALIL